MNACRRSSSLPGLRPPPSAADGVDRRLAGQPLGSDGVTASPVPTFRAAPELRGFRPPSTHAGSGEEGGMTDLEVHPAAAVFPMMSEEELDDLAADIYPRR